MPIIIPILAGAAVISGIGYGLKKSLQARKDFSEASRTGSQAESRYKLAAQSERASKQQTLYYLQALGELKKQVFLNQIQHLVSVLEQAKKAGAELSDFSSELTITELHRISSLVEKTHEIEAGLIAGTATGALAAFGAFSTAGILGTASTGTAVSTLTGAAASNATLAWFGGGSLAAGGFGMAGGMVILGGIVVLSLFASEQE